jgi:hypothetical protein
MHIIITTLVHIGFNAQVEREVRALENWLPASVHLRMVRMITSKCVDSRVQGLGRGLHRKQEIYAWDLQNEG